jgi:ABC-type glycerol-3-phosphate transport system substrate-binding protein
LKKTLLILPLVLIAAALALSACGGGSSSSSGGGGDETAIEEAIETSATSTEPSKCTEVQTAEFNETESGETGAAATKACEEQVEEEEGPAESVSISNISVNGETATAEVEITGSDLNGQAVELEVTNEEGDWKLNKFLALTKFDGETLGAALEEQLGEEEGVSASLAKCVSEGFAAMSKDQAEAMIFEKDLEPVEEIAKGCE